MRERGNLSPVDLLQTDTAAAAALSHVALDQVGVDPQIVASTVAQTRRAICVYLSSANRIGIRRAHDLNRATVRRNSGVVALVEDERVVLDVAVLDLAEVHESSAFTRAQVTAHPVEVEFVVVVAGAESRTAAARQSSGEQLIPERR